MSNAAFLAYDDKGKSFNFCEEWNASQIYTNDAYVQDFVAYKGTLYACIRTTEIGTSIDNRSYWEPVISGVAGPAGTTFTPHVSSDGVLR